MMAPMRTSSAKLASKQGKNSHALLPVHFCLLRLPPRHTSPFFGHWVNLAEMKVVCEVPKIVCWVALAGDGFMITAVGSTTQAGCIEIVMLLLPLPSACVIVTPAKPTII